MTAPTVDDIPKAADLQRQLDALNQAITLLSMPGASVGGVLCNPGPEPEPPAPPAGRTAGAGPRGADARAGHGQARAAA